MKINKKVENFVKLRHVLYSKGAIEVKPLFEQEEEVKMEEIKVGNGGSIVSVIRQYLGEMKIVNIDNKKILSIFNTIAEEVK